MPFVKGRGQGWTDDTFSSEEGMLQKLLPFLCFYVVLPINCQSI